MKQTLLLSIILVLFLIPALAQSNEKALNKTDLSSKYRISGENIKTLLFRSVEQESPNSKVYYYVTVCTNGDAVMYRYVKDWAIQSFKQGKLTAKQIEEMKQMLTVPNLRLLSRSSESKDGERFTTFTFFDGVDYQPYNYRGALPIEMQQVLDYVKAEINKQQRSIYSN